MSSGSQERRAELLGELARELQQLNGLSASFFRAAAARIGVTVTDMQVIESLASTGPMTAGQLAELTGLTTGAITGMLNRLEEAGLVRRERDPEDGRRVIVQLAADTDQIRNMGQIFELIHKAWEEQTAHYDDEQIAFLVEFLKRGNAVARKELAWLREAPSGEEGVYSAPLGNLASGQLVIPSGLIQLALRASRTMDELFQARFEGTLPDVKADNGVVTIRYPRRLWILPGAKQSAVAEVTLNASIPWRISIKGGASVINAELGGLELAGLEIAGGMSMIRVDLPAPSGVVPIRMSGGASEIDLRRPAGVPARVHLKGWVSTMIFDDQTFSNMGSDVRLQSPGFEATAPHFDIEVSSSASMITITTG
jgi:DNA-binding MarR family transcriptional regulator